MAFSLSLLNWVVRALSSFVRRLSIFSLNLSLACLRLKGITKKPRMARVLAARMPVISRVEESDGYGDQRSPDPQRRLPAERSGPRRLLRWQPVRWLLCCGRSSPQWSGRFYRRCRSVHAGGSHADRRLSPTMWSRFCARRRCR